MSVTRTEDRKILSPFDKREVVRLKEAAAVANTSVSTMRNWCNEHGLGRRIGGDPGWSAGSPWRCSWMAIRRPCGLIMRGIEQAIWWRRISSVLGYEPISSPVRYVRLKLVRH